MKPCLILVFTLKLTLLLSQPVKYYTPPEIPKQGKTMSSFVPLGWAIVDSTRGDLNGDNAVDLAFVLKSKDSLISYSFYEFEGEERVNRVVEEKYPRCILIVALKDVVKDSFRIIEQSYSMIRALTGQRTTLELQNKHLKIEYRSTDSTSSYAYQNQYFFTYQQGQLYLIKVDSFSRNGAWTEHAVVDLNSQTLELTKAKVNTELTKTVSKKIDDLQPKTMKEFKTPGTWYIGEGVMI